MCYFKLIVMNELVIPNTIWKKGQRYVIDPLEYLSRVNHLVKFNVESMPVINSSK